MRTFKLYRKEDLTGTSGCGVVAQGTVNDSGAAQVRWLVDAKLCDGSLKRIRTVTHFETWQDVVLLHGHGGRTVLVWDDSQVEVSDIELLKVG